MQSQTILREKLKDAIVKAKVRRDREFDFTSSFNFLNSHVGIRKSKLHVILGTAGGGKSTLTRSILLDVIKNNPNAKIKMWLSEETRSDYEKAIYQVSETLSVLRNVLIMSESSGDSFEDFVKTKADVFMFDNITTSSLYEGKPIASQSKFLMDIKKHGIKSNEAMVLIAHTKSDIARLHGKLITANDIRGLKTLTNLAEFFYIIQSINISDQMTQFLFLDKHRGQNPKDKVYVLRFSSEKKFYTGDNPISFKTFADLFRDRDRV